MANHLIRAALAAYLERAETPSEAIDRYEIRTRQLRGSELYPCPSCFLRGDEQALELHLAGDNVDQVFCPICKGRWDVPIPIE
jgi:hypothetical protein